MIKTEQTTTTTNPAVVLDRAAKLAKKAEAERARRAKIKAAKAAAAAEAGEVAPPPAKTEPKVTVCPPSKALREMADRKEKIEAQAEAQVAKARNGLCMTRAQALAEACAAYGDEAKLDVDFMVKKTVRGDWFWGPFKAEVAPTRKVSNEEFAAKRAAKRVEKANQKAAKKAAKASGAPAGKTKNEIMLDMVCAKGGATEQEICDAIGWKACLVTLKRAAEKFGVTLRAERVKGERARYFGKR